MTEIRNKHELLAQINEGWTELIAFLDSLSDEQLTHTYPPDGWSIKDVLAHITFWERYALERLQEAGRGEEPRMMGNVPDTTIDEVNSGALVSGRQQTLAEVRADFEETHAALVPLVEVLPDSADDPWWSVWPDTELPWQVIQWNTVDHYAEHLVDMLQWVGRE
ncbi:MAG: ClbS/DfsB family four-helix bundle protein [Chloroflexi bacterium]|nr:ClbS/DfsB family four-helix bundle protein [Chloroflexota bacterium]